MPTARPARMALIQFWRMESVTSAASARKIMEMAMFHVPNAPAGVGEAVHVQARRQRAQHAHHRGKLQLPEQTHALNPSNIIVNGVNISRYISGEIIVARIVARLGEDGRYVHADPPMVQPFPEMKYPAAGHEAALIAPSWLSLAHITQWAWKA